jgi:hypothetical protein
VSKAIVDRFEIVCKVGHKISHFVFLIVLLRKILSMIKHSTAEMGFHKNSGAKKADTPKKSAKHHYQDDNYHWQTYFVEQEIHIEYMIDAINVYDTVVYSVDYHSI